MPVPVEAMPLAGLVDLVNGWGTTPRVEAGEQDLPYPASDSLADRLGIPGGAAPPEATLRSVADSLYPVFATGDRTARGDRLNQLLASTKVRPTLRPDGRRLRADWLVPDARQAVLAAAAVALLAHLAENDADRLGVCAGRRCADAYVDASPNGHRRFCSSTCSSRARVAAFRSRRPSPT